MGRKNNSDSIKLDDKLVYSMLIKFTNNLVGPLCEHSCFKSIVDGYTCLFVFVL